MECSSGNGFYANHTTSEFVIMFRADFYPRCKYEVYQYYQGEDIIYVWSGYVSNSSKYIPEGVSY